MKRLFPALLVLAASCSTPDLRQEAVERALALGKEDDAFQDLLRGGDRVLDVLKAFLPAAGERGFPAAAILYAQGEGDAVPLDLKARHYAAFRWPVAHAQENALVEPAVWDELEVDLLRAGRSVLPLLARALAKESPDEKCALRAARVMMRIGGRPAREAFAGLLDVRRDLGGARVMDVAAAALLVLGHQDLPLRQPDPEAIAEAARRRWAELKDADEEAWVRRAAAELATLRKDKDPEGVEAVLELLEAGKDGDLKAQLDRLSAGRGPAYDANRRLEGATGQSAWMPVWERVGELRAALRLWKAPADLETRWRRLAGEGLLRMSLVVLGYRPKEGAGAVLWAQETCFHPTEGDAVDLLIPAAGYELHVRARERGTRAVLGEFGPGVARIEEATVVRPRLHFSSVLKSAVIVTVEEVEARPAPRPPDAVKRETRRQLKALALEGGDYARALAYFQDPADLPFFRERGAGAALLLLGDPAGLEFRPSLEPWEIDLALRVATDAGVRGYLEELRTSARR